MALILVIDDDPQIRLLLHHALEAEGHVVQEASTGRQGIAIATSSSPDLVITDVVMPDTDGLEVTRALHRALPATRIIVCAGSAEYRDYHDVAKMLGAHRTLKKPFLLAELYDAIRQELHSSLHIAMKTETLA